MRLLLAEICKFTQHLVGGMKINGAGLVCVLEFHTRKQDMAVKLVLGIQKMRVRGCDDGLAQLFAKRHNAPVVISQRLLVRSAPLVYHEMVVANRLYLKIIVIGCDILYVAFRTVVCYGSEKLACLARRADDKTLAVAVKLAFGYARHAAVIVKIAERHQLVKVFKSRQIFDENYHVVGLKRQRVGVGAYLRN